MNTLRIVLCLTGSSFAALLACDDIPGSRIVLPGGPDGVGGGAGFPQGLGVGEDCSTLDCRSGLICNEDEVCVPDGSLGLNQPCTIGPECADGLHCQFAPPAGVSLCLPAGSATTGDACETDLDCESGLRCALQGFSAVCLAAGEGDVGATCLQQTDCYQGLYCTYPSGGPPGVCSYPVPPLGVPLWSGVECPARENENVQALFHVPGANGTPENATFFDLPYPNDVRLENGRPNLDGFPVPGPGLLGVDMVSRYVEAVETNTHGWSTNPTIYFRFSGPINLDSLRAPEGQRRRVAIADVDNLPDDPNSNPPGGYLSTQYATGSRTNYVCDDWFALRTPRDTLIPGHRYVAWITTDARSREGNEPVQRSPQFAQMLASSRPSSGSGLRDAYDAFAPLREFIAFYEGSDNEIDPDGILIATVFTTDDPIEPMRALAESVSDAAVPTASNWVRCSGQTQSPCPQADAVEGRACGTGTADYDEYQALIRMPIFQEGTPPYLAEGGNIANEPVRTEDVCLSMSIPKNATAPSDGWPLIIYGHGTGGSYRGPLRNSIATQLSRSSPAFATLGYDAVQHGPRRGEGEDAQNDPENLFFNFVNPEAARGNPLQGAADVLSVLRFAQTGSLATATQTGGVAIQVDPDKIYYYGHSQGSTHGSIAVPFSDLVGTVLSGNGGGLADALINKTNPVNIAGALPYVIQDADANGNLRMGDKHPVLSLLQHYIDPADPLNFAPLFTSRPEPSQTPKHVFQTFGLDDTYSPPTTMASFIYAGGLALAPHPSGVSPSGVNELRILPAAGPVSANFTLDGTTVTAVTRQYAPPSGSDGHFVVDEVPQANADAIGFLEALGNGIAPTVPAP